MNLILKKQKKEKKFTANSYAHLREIQERSKPKNSGFKKVLGNVTFKRKAKRALLIIVLPLFTFIAIGVFALTSDLFKINTINVSGKNNEYVQLDFLKNRNIFTVSASSIESQIKKENQNVEAVLVQKVLPDELNVEITLNKIEKVLYSLNSYNVVDDENNILQSKFYNFELTEREKNLINNKVNLDDEQFKEEYLLTLKPEEIPTFDWSKVKREVKQQLHDKHRSEAVKKLNSYKDQVIKDIDALNLESTVIKIFFNRFESTERINEPRRVEFTRKAVNGLKKHKVKLTSIKWNSLLTLEITSDQNVKVLFSFDRIIEDQIFDLNSVIWNNKFKKDRTIDLRTENFEIR